jgi:hypothetical protein
MARRRITAMLSGEIMLGASLNERAVSDTESR